MISLDNKIIKMCIDKKLLDNKIDSLFNLAN